MPATPSPSTPPDPVHLGEIGYMNILHISDLHFGPNHWDGDEQALLEKINSYDADIVINTGDSTTDGLESEYVDAGQFLDAIACRHTVSTPGNHDKRSKSAHELFRTYIDRSEIITIPETTNTRKKHLFLDGTINKVSDNFTDINYIKYLSVGGTRVLLISIDSNELYSNDGFVEPQILDVVSTEIKQADYDLSLLMTHYSVLGTDECPLKNSACVIDFVRHHGIEYVFCGHTHQLELMRTTNIYHGNSFTQLMCGTLASLDKNPDGRMFLYYENFGSTDMRIIIVRIFLESGVVRFEEERVEI
jgi:3',5'-cyclic AMP phosphodiesterase CpdA